VGGHSAVKGFDGEIFECLDFVAGNTAGAQQFIWRIKKELGRWVAAKVFADAAMNGGRGLAVELLIEDGFE